MESTRIVQPKAPLVADEAIGGYTLAQIAAFTGHHFVTIYNWANGITINGVSLKLETFTPPPPSRAQIAVTPKEWARFWAAYLEARATRRPRRAAHSPASNAAPAEAGKAVAS